jgi:hypothetical protein
MSSDPGARLVQARDCLAPQCIPHAAQSRQIVEYSKQDPQGSEKRPVQRVHHLVEAPAIVHDEDEMTTGPRDPASSPGELDAALQAMAARRWQGEQKCVRSKKRDSGCLQGLCVTTSVASLQWSTSKRNCSSASWRNLICPSADYHSSLISGQPGAWELSASR